MSAGRVGIGTGLGATPNHLLSVGDSITTAYTPTAFNTSRHKLMLTAGSADQSAALIRWGNHGSMENTFGVVQMGSSGQGDFIWQSFDGSNYAERMRLDEHGNLCIGFNVAPGYKLDVEGTGRFDSTLSVGGILTIAGGSPADGKVWTATDSNGAGQWETPLTVGTAAMVMAVIFG